MRLGNQQSVASSNLVNLRPSSIPDEILIRAMVERDKRAVKLLYVRHHTRIFRFVVRLVGNESIAEEVVNDVFLQAWRHAREFKGDFSGRDLAAGDCPVQSHLGGQAPLGGSVGREGRGIN